MRNAAAYFTLWRQNPIPVECPPALTPMSEATSRGEVMSLPSSEQEVALSFLPLRHSFVKVLRTTILSQSIVDATASIDGRTWWLVET